MLIPIGDDNPTRSFPFVNVLIILGNAAVWGYMFVAPVFKPSLPQGGDLAMGFVAHYGFVPSRMFQNMPVSMLAQGHTMVTSLFLHASLAHLLGNMLFLWIVGDNIEDCMGHGKFFVYYLLLGVAAAIGHLVMSLSYGPAMGSTPCIGASGAISGVMGAYVVLFPGKRIRFFYWFFFILAGTWRISSFVAIGAWFAMQYLMASSMPGAATGVAYWAHVWGFMVGAGSMLLFRLTGLVRPEAA